MKEKIPAEGAGSGPETASGALPRVLGGVDGAALAVGIVVGTGIFAVPGYVAGDLGAPGPFLLVWVLGAAIALCGALTYAEVGAMYPRQGGGFLFVLHAYGPFAAFFKGWGSFLVGYPASSAGIAMVFGIYLAEAAGWGEGAVRPAALGAAAAVWVLNLRGTRFSGLLQRLLTFAKVGAIGLLALAALALAEAPWERLTAATGAGWPPLSAFAAALVGVLWTFDGWENLTVIGGEIGDPRRRIVRGLLLTIGLVTALYLVVNVAYVVVLPFEELSGNASAASAVAERLLGPGGARLVSALIAGSAFGALFGIGMAGPRYFWSMATHGLFFRFAGRLSPERSAPRGGATALFVATAVYIVTGTFEQIFSYYIGVSLLYNVLTVTTVFRLRALRPDAPRPFRVPGYPVVPAVFIAAALWIAGTELAAHPVRSGIGLLVLLSSLPAYRLWKKVAPSKETG